jgi:hypothetical protein
LEIESKVLDRRECTPGIVDVVYPHIWSVTVTLCYVNPL